MLVYQVKYIELLKTAILKTVSVTAWSKMKTGVSDPLITITLSFPGGQGRLNSINFNAVQELNAQVGILLQIVSNPHRIKIIQAQMEAYAQLILCEKSHGSFTSTTDLLHPSTTAQCRRQKHVIRF